MLRLMQHHEQEGCPSSVLPKLVAIENPAEPADSVESSGVFSHQYALRFTECWELLRT